jgi:hypothetical protein
MLSDFSLLVAKYNSSLPTLSDGQANSLQVDVNGRLLVQADVTVLIDFLGLNGAANSANILIVGTEDGTGGGTAHAVRLASDGAVMINDNGGSITVDASNLDIRDLVFATDKVDVSGSSNVAVTDGGGSLTVDASDLDIRDLSHSQDSIKVGDGTDFLAVNTDGSINITDNGGSLTVDAVNLDIRDLAFSTDKVDVSGSVVALDAPTLAALESITVQNGAGAAAVNIQDGGNSITVDASDLDIRDLSHSQDSVKIGDGTDFLAVNADGSINVQATVSFAGSEEYAATDALAAGADGLVTITAAATPWIDAATIAVGAGQILHLYGFDWTCDQNANARLISDDGVDIIVYKHSLNSSAMPDQFKYWGEAGRIEIAGAAGKSVKLQIKKRSTTGGNAQSFGSLHARLV